MSIGRSFIQELAQPQIRQASQIQELLSKALDLGREEDRPSKIRVVELVTEDMVQEVRAEVAATMGQALVKVAAKCITLTQLEILKALVAEYQPAWAPDLLRPNLPGCRPSPTVSCLR